MAITTVVVSPTSRKNNICPHHSAAAQNFIGGSVTLASSNPFDAPIINPNFLATEFDIFTMRAAMRSAGRFVSAPAWRDYVLAPFGGLENITTDADLDEYIRSGAVSISHPVGTAAMSPKGATHGVVDPDLRVKRVSGLRIVDASILVSRHYPSHLPI